MEKTLANATLVSSCDNVQTAAWFAAYLTACQYLAEARGLAIYAVDMNATQVSTHWADFLTNWQPRVKNRRDDWENAETKVCGFGLELAIAQGAFLETPSAKNYTTQERLSLKYQEATTAAREAQEAFNHAVSFADLAEETKARLAQEERDRQISRMAQKVWARERAERAEQDDQAS